MEEHEHAPQTQDSLATSEPAPVARGRDERIVRRTIPCDVLENDTAFLVIGELPGVAREDLTVEIQANTLIVRGERRIDSEITKFERSFVVPDAADVDQVQATLDAGLLRLEIGKTSRSRPKRIPVG